MKKAQSEIIGLLLIVVIISFIILFAFSRSLVKPDDTMSEFKGENLVSSMISAALRTNTDCNDNLPDMRTLIIDCAKSENSPSTGIKCDDNKNSCDFFNETLKTMLDDTLSVWKEKYELKIMPPNYNDDSDLLIHIKQANKTRTGRVSTATQPLPVGTNYGSLNIMLCLGGTCPDLS